MSNDLPARDLHTPPPLPLPYATPMDAPYASATPRARIVIGLLWASIALQVLGVWPSLLDIRQLRAVAQGAELPDELSASDVANIVYGFSMGALLLVGVVFWMMWVHRTYRNLRALGAEGLTYSPAWAVWYYFIPILNLFRPYQVMRQTWQASDPSHSGGTDWHVVRPPALLAWWWALHIISSVVNQISFRIAMRSEDVDVLLRVAWVDLAMLVFDSVLALVEIRLVTALTALQEQRAGDSGTIPAATPLAV